MGFEIALMIVGALIAIVGMYSLGVSVWLMRKYVKYNRQENSAGLTGHIAFFHQGLARQRPAQGRNVVSSSQSSSARKVKS